MVVVILCLCVIFYSCLVDSTSAIDCLERLVPKMTYYVSSGTLNSTRSLRDKPIGSRKGSGRLATKALSLSTCL